MKTLKNIILIALVFCIGIFVLQSCEQVIDLPVQDYEGNIVIYSVLESDSVPKVFVTESEPYYTYVNSSIKYQLLNNASIKISNGQQTWDLTVDSVSYLPIERNYWYWGPDGPPENSEAVAFTNSELILQPNTAYTITVEKGNRTATANTFVLNRPLDYTVEYKEEIETYYGYEYVNRYVEFSYVNAEPGLYYRMVKREKFKQYICDFSQYPAVLLDSALTVDFQFSYREKSDVLNEIVTDEMYVYANSCYENHQCYTNYTQLDSVEIEIALQVIDSTLIKYINQLQFQEDVSYNPFLEPAPVDHNVEGGIGIVGAITNTPWQTIKIPCQ